MKQGFFFILFYSFFYVLKLIIHPVQPYHGYTGRAVCNVVDLVAFLFIAIYIGDIVSFMLIRLFQSHSVRTRNRFDVYTTSITLKRRRLDVKTTLCAYWAGGGDNIHILIKTLSVLKFFIC